MEGYVKDSKGNKIKIMVIEDKVFYKCDPVLNTMCNKRYCSYNKTGPCEYTANKEYALKMQIEVRKEENNNE